MEKPEYQYDENLSAAKNIATGLFAIANEISRLIDNNFEQSKKASFELKEGLSVIAQELKHIFESLPLLSQKTETIEQQTEPYFDFDTAGIETSIDNAVKELEAIKEILKKHFTDEDEDEYGYDYDSND